MKLSALGAGLHSNHKSKEVNIFDIKEYGRQYYIDNSEKIKDRSRQWCIDNPEKVKEYRRQYYKNNSEKIIEKMSQWQINNTEKRKKHRKQYRINNLEKIKENKRQKYKIDAKFNLGRKISYSIYISIKGNKAGRHWENLVGYTLIDLIKHLKKNIPKNYTWQDCLDGRLHIDHIIPISVFNFSKPEHIDFKRCWELKNLRLLPSKENLIKHNKLDRPFQPALKI